MKYTCQIRVFLSDRSKTFSATKNVVLHDMQERGKKATRKAIEGWIAKTEENIKNHKIEKQKILDMMKKIPGSEARMKRAIAIIDQTITKDQNKIEEYKKLLRVRTRRLRLNYFSLITTFVT